MCQMIWKTDFGMENLSMVTYWMTPVAGVKVWWYIHACRSRKEIKTSSINIGHIISANILFAQGFKTLWNIKSKRRRTTLWNCDVVYRAYQVVPRFREWVGKRANFETSGAILKLPVKKKMVYMTADLHKGYSTNSAISGTFLYICFHEWWDYHRIWFPATLVSHVFSKISSSCLARILVFSLLLANTTYNGERRGIRNSSG